MGKIFKIVFIIIGTIIGAGFASGKEIYIFFYKFGISGIFGIIFASTFFGIVIFKLLLKIKEKNINNYNELLEILNKKYPKINEIIKNIINLFLLISFFIMIACFSTFIKQIYNIPIYISSSLFCFFCSLIFLNNNKGLVKINEILVPILIILIILLGIKNMQNVSSLNLKKINNENNFRWLISAILYISYNSIILIPVISNLNLKKLNKKQIKYISIFSSLIIILLATIIFSLLNSKINDIIDLEIPLLPITSDFGKIFKYLYELIIIISIFTSCIGSGFGFLKNISENRKQYIFFLILINILGIFISNLGFSKLIENLYPVFGALGILQIILIIK